LAVEARFELEHARGIHGELVSGCQYCDLTSRLADELAAHTRGEHEDFDYRDKNAIAPCAECRVSQWSWYENLARIREEDDDGVATGLLESPGQHLGSSL
jgi:hypothetical protein